MKQHPDPQCAALEASFHEILNSRMQDLPIINTALQVQAVGFNRWNNYSLGVLITPWFINLILLPQDDTLHTLSVGDKQQHGFPSGSYEFIVSEDEIIGHYLSCSLFSPVFEFDSQQQAVKVAIETLNRLMDADSKDSSTWSDRQLIDEHWQDVIQQSDTETVSSSSELCSKIQRSVSRRDLLRGQILVPHETSHE